MRRKTGDDLRHTAVILITAAIILASAAAFFVGRESPIESEPPLITGFGTSATTTISISIGNNVPQIDFISAPSSVSITEGGAATFSFTFNVTDLDGASNINSSTATGTINITGLEPGRRQNTTCSFVSTSDSNTNQYNCTISFFYFDRPGNYSINASIIDNNKANASNATGNLQILQTTAMVMSPSAITWPSVNVGDTNKTANNDPITINNTGNKNISVNTSADQSGISITAVNLQGSDDNTKFILAQNFTVDVDTGGTCSGPACTECDGTFMLNSTGAGISKAVNGSILTRGNLSNNEGNETIYFCLTKVQSDLSAQSYSTAGGGAWTVSVS